MSATMVESETYVISLEKDWDEHLTHIVCHCTNDNTSACGKDVTNEPWGDDISEECPLCRIVWPVDAQKCPWGCSCPECVPVD